MTSRRQLYAIGEPFGDSATHRTAGRLICGGGGGGGSSSSSTSTTTHTTDKRLVVDAGIGISSDASTVTVNALDAGIVNKALDTVAGADAVAGQSFDKLLTLADKMFTQGFDTVSTQQEQVSAFAADVRGTIDGKTMMVLAVVAAVAFIGSKKA